METVSTQIFAVVWNENKFSVPMMSWLNKTHHGSMNYKTVYVLVRISKIILIELTSRIYLLAPKDAPLKM